MPTKADELRFLPSITLLDDELGSETSYQRAVSTIVHPLDATVQDQMNIVEASGSLSFWDDPAEDIYNENDGDAV